MRPSFPVLFLAVTCFSAAVGTVSLEPRCAADDLTAAQQEVEKLIAQLGSDDFEAREAATQRLMKRDDAVSAVRRARKSSDAEVAHRAETIFAALSRRTDKQDFARLSELAKRGAVDQAIELFVQRETWEDEPACWEVMANLAQKLSELARKTHEKVNLSDPHSDGNADFTRAVDMLGLNPKNLPRPRPILWHGHLVVRGKTTLQRGMAIGSLFALSGEAHASLISSSIVFTGESVSAGDGVTRTLVVCDGDFEAIHIRKSIVIARGNVRCKLSADGSLIISGGKVQFDYPKNVRDTKVIEKEAKPLGFVKFFDPADAGIKVESAKSGVRVKEAAKGKRFAAAGIQADDVILAIEGESASDAEAFRRLLRMNLAIGGEFILKVRRGDKVLEVRVPEKS